MKYKALLINFEGLSLKKFFLEGESPNLIIIEHLVVASQPWFHGFDPGFLIFI